MVDVAGAVNLAVPALSNVTATVKPSGLPSYTARGIFTAEYVEAGDISGYAPVLHGLLADLDPDGSIDGRSEVWINGDLYRVANRQPDGTGYVLWRLEKDPEL